ncbi:MAG TPA: dihydrofolate reductase family protein [Acidimicrobiales bacterium]|nr:dihydrofolate reductase family protein [Acidimicrobiales bacterium]
MATVVADLSMSLDGFIADSSDAVPYIFDWYENGDVVFEWPGNDMVSRVTEASAAVLRDTVANAGALVAGRRVFDITDGWGGHHPAGCPVFVVTHNPPEDWPHDRSLTTFVTDGVASAVEQAKAAAGDKSVGVFGPNIAQQCLNLGLLDEVFVHLTPVLLGVGVPFFANLTSGPVRFDDPTVIEGKEVIHLRYKVRR